ncbi:MAG: hypothetical protein K2G45_11065 [Lachnospiraceae bacterium]|nr:hypothetical protein [Lachnospiraceae bacterium]
MKKRIITSWLVTFGVIFMVFLGLFLLYISSWAHGSSKDGVYYAQAGFEFGTGAGLGNTRSICQKTKNDASFEYSVNCLEINGEIVFKVYYVHDVVGTTDEKKMDSVSKIHERGDSVMVLEQRIDEIGTYRFDLSDEKNGFYIFCIDAAQPDTRAKGTEELTKYSSNWSVLMDRIGVK